MKTILLLFFCITSLSFGSLAINEVMIDPAALADTEGEYIELHNNDFYTHFSDSLYLVKDRSDTLFADYAHLLPRSYLLICSSPYYPACITAQSLSLSNSRPTLLQIFRKGGVLLDSVIVNSLRAGYAIDIHNHTPSLATLQYRSGDWGTPGYGNPAADPELYDIKLELTCTAHQCTATPNKPINTYTAITVGIDNTLDGISEFPVDTLAPQWPLFLIPQNNPNATFLFSVIGDEYPVNNLYYFSQAPLNKRLHISEIYPAPASNEEEWFELYNGSSSPIDLGTITIGNKLQTKKISDSTHIVNSHDYCVIAKNYTEFIQQYGKIRTCIIEPNSWLTLSNSGDTLRLSTQHGFVSDSITWHSGTIVSGTALKRIFNGDALWQVDPLYSKGTPGTTTQSRPLKNSFTLQSRYFSPSRGEELSMQLTLAPAHSLTYSIFDFSGYALFTETITDPAKTDLTWNGVHKGAAVAPGIYIILFQFSGDAAHKVTCIVEP